MDKQQAMFLVAQELALPGQNANEGMMRQQIIEKIRELILHDMQKLISLLYRIDVDEKKIRSVLAQDRESDSASVIADLVIERQAMKIKSRQNSPRDQNMNDDEKW